MRTAPAASQAAGFVSHDSTHSTNILANIGPIASKPSRTSVTYSNGASRFIRRAGKRGNRLTDASIGPADGGEPSLTPR